jgi:hypothetical protein
LADAQEKLKKLNAANENFNQIRQEQGSTITKLRAEINQLKTDALQEKLNRLTSQRTMLLKYENLEKEVTELRVSLGRGRI